jgi:uncharacterized protein
MATKTKATADNVTEISVEEKLWTLYKLQRIDSEIDKIRTLRGELPLEVQDLEDELEGLLTRKKNLDEEIIVQEKDLSSRKNQIVESQALIKKYKDQQTNVRNNREFDSLSKEIEFQNLEIELAEKKLKEYSFDIKEKKSSIDEVAKLIDERKQDLNNKKNELNEIVEETKKDEEELANKSKDFEKLIEARLITAYKRIRKNARNGLAVVSVDRDACGGCFNKIPPQRQLDIRSRKKIIVCEYCGRILVDKDLSEEIDAQFKVR